MKHLIYTILILISACLGFFFGRYDWYVDTNNKYYPYNIKEHLNAEHEYANALFEGLHWYMRDDSAYWDTVFKNTVEYKNIEKANNGDWEDFYAPNWK